MICFQVQQGLLCLNHPCWAKDVCEYMCVCARTCAQDGKRRGGLEGTPAITADVFKMEKPLVTCVGKTTVLVQQQRLHGTYRRSGSRERTREGNRRGEEGGGWQEKIAELLQYVFTAFLLVGLYVRLLKRAHTSSACYHDPSDLPRNWATVSVTSQNQKPLYLKLFTLTWAPEKTFFSMCSFVRFYSTYTTNF